MLSQESRTPHLRALLCLVLALGPLVMSGCSARNGGRQGNAQASDGALPPRSYFVETRIVAMPPTQVGRLHAASALELDRTPGWTLYSGAGALVQLDSGVTQLPFSGEEEPATTEAELLAYASKRLRISLRDSTNQSAPSMLEVRLHSAPGIPAVDRRGEAASDGTPLVLDSGVTYQGRVLAVSVSVQKVGSHEDLRRIYEQKQLAKAAALEGRQSRGN
jgi:hypothetical protein